MAFSCAAHAHEAMRRKRVRRARTGRALMSAKLT